MSRADITFDDVIDLLRHTIRQKQGAVNAIPTFCTLEGKITKAMLEVSLIELRLILRDLETAQCNSKA